MEKAQVKTAVIEQFWPYNKPKPMPAPKPKIERTPRRIKGSVVDANFEQWRKRAEHIDPKVALSRK